METSVKKSNSIVKHGVQAIILIGMDQNIFSQKYLLVEDYDDRDRGDGIRRLGLPGGGIEKNEIPHYSIVRELHEEVSLNIRKNFVEYFGCYQKKRPNGFINDNHLFIIRLINTPKLKTNDPNEVSKVHVLTLREIISLSTKGFIHEGSIRLIVHFLNDKRFGSLNEPAILRDLIFF
jgi:ADP-ribose pyrophosphatase YjhB (NUDIX family)